MERKETKGQPMDGAGEEQVAGGPPPTRRMEAEDVHQHRRESDGPATEPRKHRRWYDGMTGIMVAASALSAALGIGYAGHDFVDKVEETPQNVTQLAARTDSVHQSNTEEHNRLWQAVNANRQDVADMKERLDLAVQLLYETTCVLQADSDSARARCSSESTRRRIQEIMRTGGGG